jgi:hypothetical protein
MPICHIILKSLRTICSNYTYRQNKITINIRYNLQYWSSTNQINKMSIDQENTLILCCFIFYSWRIITISEKWDNCLYLLFVHLLIWHFLSFPMLVLPYILLHFLVHYTLCFVGSSFTIFSFSRSRLLPQLLTKINQHWTMLNHLKFCLTNQHRLNTFTHESFYL